VHIASRVKYTIKKNFWIFQVTYKHTVDNHKISEIGGAKRNGHLGLDVQADM